MHDGGPSEPPVAAHRECAPLPISLAYLACHSTSEVTRLPPPPGSQPRGDSLERRDPPQLVCAQEQRPMASGVVAHAPVSVATTVREPAGVPPATDTFAVRVDGFT